MDEKNQPTITDWLLVAIGIAMLVVDILDRLGVI
jgi:hypothetical protein